MGRFTPVCDPERARSEQDEESLRKHRQFDAPHAHMAKDLNKGYGPKEDMKPMGRPTGELELDAAGLWRKKNDLFEKKKLWGRETFEYSNPEEARDDADAPRKRRPGDVGWGVRGNFGGRGEDSGALVVQRGEVNQALEKNEKGLWVRKKKGTDEDDEPKLDKAFQDAAMALLRQSGRNEDPRLEAAKPKGRDCANASQKALEALAERRRKERIVKDEMGLTSRPANFGSSSASGGGRVRTLNSTEQVEPSQRARRTHKWQGVQRSDEDARKIVGKAEGSANIGKNLPESCAVRIEPTIGRKKERSPSPLALSEDEGSRSRSRSPAGAEVVVDFF